jgi:hypothetical protein
LLGVAVYRDHSNQCKRLMGIMNFNITV